MDADQASKSIDTSYNRHLHAFHAVAQKGSFLAASKELFISQPALTKQINLLENRLGFTLFTRSNKGVELTKAGQRFLEGSLRLDREYQQLVDECRGIETSMPQVLRVGYYTNTQRNFSLMAVEAFRQEYPSEELELVEITTESCIQDLLKGKIDVYTGYESRRLDTDKVDFMPLSSWDYYAVVPVNHPLSANKILTAHDLVGCKVLLPPYGLFRGTDDLTDWLVSQDKRADIKTEIYNNTTNFRCMMEGRIVINFGIALKDSSFTIVPLEWTPKAVHGIISRSNASLNVRRFIEIAQNISQSRLRQE